MSRIGKVTITDQNGNIMNQGNLPVTLNTNEGSIILGNINANQEVLILGEVKNDATNKDIVTHYKIAFNGVEGFVDANKVSIALKHFLDNSNNGLPNPFPMKPEDVLCDKYGRPIPGSHHYHHDCIHEGPHPYPTPHISNHHHFAHDYEYEHLDKDHLTHKHHCLPPMHNAIHDGIYSNYEPAYNFWAKRNIEFSPVPPRNPQAFWLRYTKAADDASGEYTLWVYDIPTHTWVQLYAETFNGINELFKGILDKTVLELDKLPYRFEINENNRLLELWTSPYKEVQKDENDKPIIDENGDYKYIEYLDGVKISEISLDKILPLHKINNYGNIIQLEIGNGNDKTVSGSVTINAIGLSSVTGETGEITIKTKTPTKGYNTILVEDDSTFKFNAPEYKNGTGIIITEKEDVDNHKVYEISTDSSVYKFRGSVEYYENLPTDAEEGDVWNVINGFTKDNKTYEDGCNFAWTTKNGNHWDSLGSIIDYPKITVSGNTRDSNSTYPYYVSDVSVDSKDDHKIIYTSTNFESVATQIKSEVKSEIFEELKISEENTLEKIIEDKINEAITEAISKLKINIVATTDTTNSSAKFSITSDEANSTLYTNIGSSVSSSSSDNSATINLTSKFTTSNSSNSTNFKITGNNN